METDDQSSNELETLFQLLTAELDTHAAESFQNVLLVRTALSALPLLAAGLPSPDEGAEANMYFLSHLRSLITQCCCLNALTDLTLASSVETAIAQVKETSKRLGIWLPNGNVTILAEDIALRLSAHTSEPSTADILAHYFSFFAAASYLREVQRVRQELERLPDKPKQLFNRKLTSSFGTLNWQEKLSHDCWSFWRDWYQGFLDGKPLDWDLQRRVALIDDPIWDAGPEAIATEIERIKAEMLSEKLPMAEAIELNPETGKFRAVPIAVENAPYMSALLSQISDALEDCLGGHNGLAERSGDVRKLNRVLTKYKDDPQNAELTLTRVAGSLRGQLHDSRELPDNEDNLALLNAVEESVRGIRANHPEVTANRDQLAQQAFKALTPEDKQLLEKALPVLAAISEPELAEDFEQDIPELINDALLPLPNGAPKLPGADAATRIFSRSSKMAPLWEKLNAAHDGKVHRIATMGLAAYAVSELLVKLVSLGLRLLGVL
ncbi:hypothetical protein [Leisingera sp. F5]|uniref:hypothetical protein n=1 Tax=Leisingera sp. F5 TaxID=1813816 RepID=UPI000ABA7C4C|nr:hypothetical protein [Leisingera sp. F5]